MTMCFGLPKTYHRYDRRHGPWEWSSTSTDRMKDGGLDYRKGGTGVPFLGGTGECDMLSHLGGTGMELLCRRKVK